MKNKTVLLSFLIITSSVICANAESLNSEQLNAHIAALAQQSFAKISRMSYLTVNDGNIKRIGGVTGYYSEREQLMMLSVVCHEWCRVDNKHSKNEIVLSAGRFTYWRDTDRDRIVFARINE